MEAYGVDVVFAAGTRCVTQKTWKSTRNIVCTAVEIKIQEHYDLPLL
jgi:hypothetical protein